MNYWQKRSEQRLEASLRSTRGVERYMKKMYKDNAEWLIDEYKMLMDHFGVIREDGSIDVDALNFKNYYDHKFRSRRRYLEQAIYNTCTKLATVHEKKLFKALSKVYTLNYYGIQKDLERKGALVTFSKLNTNVIEHAVKMPWSKNGTEFSQVIWKQRDTMTERLRNVISTGLLNGDGVDKMTKEIVKEYGVGFHQAQRLIRTETAAVYSNATLDAYKESGVVEDIEILAEPDACDICEDASKDLLSLEDAHTGMNTPPFHPNCRCSIAPKIRL